MSGRPLGRGQRGRTNVENKRQRAYTGVASGFKPFRDRAVLTLTVDCPSCPAKVGEGCRTATGKATTHQTRRRMALRKEREENQP